MGGTFILPPPSLRNRYWRHPVNQNFTERKPFPKGNFRKRMFLLPWLFKLTTLRKTQKFDCCCEREIIVWIAAKQGRQFVEWEQNIADIITVSLYFERDTHNISNFFFILFVDGTKDKLLCPHIWSGNFLSHLYLDPRIRAWEDNRPVSERSIGQSIF